MYFKFGWKSWVMIIIVSVLKKAEGLRIVDL